MKPRYAPGYNRNGREEFIGYANDLDVYLEHEPHGAHVDYVLVVGPDERKIYNSIGDAVFNYDAFTIEDGVLQEEGTRDIHITPHDMCLIYQLLAEHDVI